MAIGQKKDLTSSLKKELDRYLEKFHRKDFLPTDPLHFAHRYKERDDQELIAFLASLFAYGNVRTIHNALEILFDFLGEYPTQFLQTISTRSIQSKLKTFVYRFYRPEDIEWLLLRLREIIRKHQSLEKFYLAHIDSKDLYPQRLASFRLAFLKGAPNSHGARFFIPDPTAGAAKRFHMLMRWLVRKDEVDLGLWTSVKPAQLWFPVDTHIFQISQKLGITQRKSISFQTTQEISDFFRSLCPEDPVKYDFALCRIGILRQKHLVPSYSATGAPQDEFSFISDKEK